MEIYLLPFYFSLVVFFLIFHKRKTFKIYFTLYALVGFSFFSFYIVKDIRAYEVEMKKLQIMEER